MNTEHDEPLNIQEIPHLLSKHRSLILASTLICGGLFTAASVVMPKKYKAHFVLTVYSKYFQSSLIGDFVPELSESGEMRSQRESLIRQVLTPEFLDFLAAKYGIYRTSAPQSEPTTFAERSYAEFRRICEASGICSHGSIDSRLSAERQELISRIEIFDLSNTTFNIAFSYSDPAVTFHVTQDLRAEIIQSLLQVRQHILMTIRDAIERRVNVMAANMPALPSEGQPPAVLPPAEQELKEVRDELRTMTGRYTETHPLIQQLRSRERSLQRDVNMGAGVESEESRDLGKLRVERESSPAMHDIYGDLSRKLNYLNIAIDSDKQHQDDYFATLESPLYPVTPLWPKKGLMVLWGMALGFFGSLFVAAIKEYFERSALHAGALAQSLGVPQLGSLPVFSSKH